MSESNAEDAQSDAFLEAFLPGTSAGVIEARRTILKLNSPINGRMIRLILVTGESGAGKNHYSRVLSGHREWLQIRNSEADLGISAGLRHYCASLPEVNLPSLSESVAESELFGNVKGSFTDATGRKGLLALDGKDILLDEIGDATLQLQAKLLTVIDTGRFRPVGANDEEQCSARMILATNKQLAEMVSRREFREDLLWRISAFIIRVPPLREQRENIPAIIRGIESELDEDLSNLPGERHPLPALSDAQVRWAQSQPWRGNVRELKDVVRRWRFESGQVPLDKVAQTIPADMIVRPKVSTGGSLTDIVHARLDEARADPSQGFGTLQALIDGFKNEVQSAVVAWYDSRRPSGADLSAMFNACQIRSVQNKIAKWKRD